MSDIDLKKAADATLKYMGMAGDNAEPLIVDGRVIPDCLSLEHQTDLLNQIIRGSLWGEKAHRCFGWVQASLVINGIGDLDTYRMINYCCKVK